MKEKKTEKSKGGKQIKTGNRQTEELREKIDALQKEKDELFAKLQRVSADYANFQKRSPKHIADMMVYEKERIIKTLLPALDNFEHTLQNARSSEKMDIFVKGIRIIHDQMIDILKSHGVEQIKALGEKFDPSLHQAMMQKSQGEQEEDIILEEFQKGYKLNDRVIRPSKVVVNKLPSEQADEHEKAGEQEDMDLKEQTSDDSAEQE